MSYKILYISRIIFSFCIKKKFFRCCIRDFNWPNSYTKKKSSSLSLYHSFYSYIFMKRVVIKWESFIIFIFIMSFKSSTIKIYYSHILNLSFLFFFLIIIRSFFFLKIYIYTKKKNIFLYSFISNLSFLSLSLKFERKEIYCNSFFSPFLNLLSLSLSLSISLSI